MANKIGENVVSERKVKILPVTKCTILSDKLSNHGLGEKTDPIEKFTPNVKILYTLS